MKLPYDCPMFNNQSRAKAKARYLRTDESRKEAEHKHWSRSQDMIEQETTDSRAYFQVSEEQSICGVRAKVGVVEMTDVKTGPSETFQVWEMATYRGIE
ncbi:hypothetical protein R1flu_001813 [Riccia fluitans]|uniref:Uncharacterized protein n=1 Tax=Riccia fluitans TaxID=41844 RepID=A0ABD1Y4C2_9MARC